MIKDTHCVHLDFHTSGDIEGIGSAFDKKEFQNAVKEAGLDSITVFAKCHHGYMYYPSEKYEVHPHLAKPLLDLQVEACKEIGVSTKIYISAGHDEVASFQHPEWMVVREDGSPQNLLEPHFHMMCYNTPYLDYLIGQTEEVTRRYMPDGLFFDIVSDCGCVCPACMRDMKKKGLDFRKHEDVMKQAKDVHIMWIKKVTDAARAIKPDVLVFFNAGDYPTGREDYVSVNDQLEAESLPTGGWGYDHFPMTMAYIRRKGKNCIGMTGKFHRSWGEFGGYKYKDALLYEGAQCVALNAGLSVGDQLHPTAKIDRYTYENIGNAVRYMKEREPWRGGDYIPEFAVFASSHSGRSGESRGRTGVCRMLFEEKYLFDLITYEEADPKKYPFLIMADEQYPLDETEYNALKDYIAKGGKLIASGKAPLYEGKIAFRLGAELLGDAPYSPSYIRPFYPGKVISDTPLVIYTPMYEINPVGKVLGEEVRPYFKRETIHFCSHNNIPCNYDSLHPAVTEGEDGFYIAAEIGTDYAKTGSLNPKQILIPLIEKLLPEKTVITNLPSSGKAVLYKKGDSYILHLLYANTVKRGEGVEVIEDLATIADIRVSLRLPTPVSAGVLRPEGTPLSLTEENGRVSFTLPKLRCSAIVELTEKK